jgi:hypothetical protein
LYRLIREFILVFKSKKEKGGLGMKRFIIIALILLFTAGTVTVFAAGGKNHGDKGKGAVSTGSGAKGTASQPRPGR